MRACTAIRIVLLITLFSGCPKSKTHNQRLLSNVIASGESHVDFSPKHPVAINEKEVAHVWIDTHDRIGKSLFLMIEFSGPHIGHEPRFRVVLSGPATYFGLQAHSHTEFTEVWQLPHSIPDVIEIRSGSETRLFKRRIL